MLATADVLFDACFVSERLLRNKAIYKQTQLQTEVAMAVPGKKISAASARAHTRNKMNSNSTALPQGMIKSLSIVMLVGLLALAYKAIQPTPPSICGSPNGPPVTASRVKLSDGRHLAYKESGVPKEKAKHKIIFIHGFDSCRHDVLQVSQAQIRQQGDFESLHRDMMVGFGTWEFSPLEIENLFPNGEGSVHLWHGAKDLIVPIGMSRYISQNLPWVHYHELPEAGHMFPLADGMPDTIVRSLLLGTY